MDNVIKWLLEDENPAVKYRTLTELLHRSADDSDVIKAKMNLVNSKLVTDIMSKTNDEGIWINDKGLFGDFTNFNFLTALAEFGLTRMDIPIDNAVNWVLTNMKNKHRCGEATLLRSFVMLGYVKDDRVINSIEETFSAQKSDGGWGCISKNKIINDPKRSHRSCIRITANSLLLASELKKCGVIYKQTEGLINYYSKRNLFYKTEDMSSLVITDNGRIGARMVDTFYPIDPVKTGLQCYLYALSVLGAGSQREFNEAWELLQNKTNNEGKYILDGTLTKQYFPAGKKGRPNKWVTLYSLLALKYKNHGV